MQRIRLWTTSLVSRVDGMVSRIENHEALADSAIRDVRRAAARATVQLRRVRADGARQRDRLGSLHEEERAWEERALRSASGDREKALECVRRGKRAARQARELARRIEEHERVEKQLAADVARVEDRLGELEQQRNVLVTRQSRAQALGSVRDAESPHADVSEVFGRWETRVAENEFEGGCLHAGDALEAEFEEEEEDASLAADLDALLERQGAREEA
jgi:phage shock protein A